MSWTHLSNHAEILAVHAAYMGFGQIVYFSGDQHDPDNAKDKIIDATRLFDCSNFTVSNPHSPGFDTFCSGHAFLVAANQTKLLVGGGTEEFPNQGQVLHHDHFPGLKNCAIFESPSLVAPYGQFGWSKAASMNPGPLATPQQQPKPDPAKTGGRWYPTLMTLASGDVIAFSGHPGSSDAAHSNNVPEIFSLKAGPIGAWRRLAPYTSEQAPGDYDRNALPFYPRVHLLPTGDILCSNRVRETTWVFKPDVGPNGGTFAAVCKFPTAPTNEYDIYTKPSVMLPLLHDDVAANAWVPKILVCGANTSWVLDLQGWPTNPPKGGGGWQWVPSAEPKNDRNPSPIRRHSVATLLPTGEVFVTGGIDVSEDTVDDPRLGPTQLDARAVLDPEIYNPFTRTWEWLKDPAPTPRNYHTVALLMPDGRVWVAGSDKDASPGMAARNLDIDIYSPWYYGNPGRPFVVDAPSLAYPGDEIQIRTTFQDEITRVVLMRCGSCTHAFNPDQRYLSLYFERRAGDALMVRMPPNNNIMPPGPYMIFTIRGNDKNLGLPSYGTDIHVVPERPNGRHQG
ncbi:DUF1929 domain-containing protein [Paraburkholderia bengalensis]|uniref:DUF1929 domain-containing protein n=1 Tax=Paraburkholderia bengalensis TaxID=2747562 RepID=A0ABU8J2U4_9BURK